MRKPCLGGDYPKNQRGETYGSVTYAKYAGYYPDLTAVRADNGKSGYVLSRDNDGTYRYPGTLDTEDEASVAAWKEWLKTRRAFNISLFTMQSVKL